MNINSLNADVRDYITQKFNKEGNATAASHIVKIIRMIKVSTENFIEFFEFLGM